MGHWESYGASWRFYWHSSVNTQIKSQMFRIQGPSRGALSCGSNHKIALENEKWSKGKRNGIPLLLNPFSCFVTAVLCTWTPCEAFWGTMVGNNERTWRGICCYQNTLQKALNSLGVAVESHVHYVIWGLYCHIAEYLVYRWLRKTVAPCWCDHMGIGRGSISSVRTGGEDFCCIIQSRTGLILTLNTRVNCVNSQFCSSV